MKKLATIMAAMAMTILMATTAFADPVDDAAAGVPEIAVRICSAITNGVALENKNPASVIASTYHSIC